MPADVEKILSELKTGLVRIHGDLLKSIYLFGSFARGEGRLPDSDIDVMVVLRGDFNTGRWKIAPSILCRHSV